MGMHDLEPLFHANRESWNTRTSVHADSSFYDVEGWKAGKTSVNPLELADLGEVAGDAAIR